MAFLTPSERRFLEGVSELAYCNPFTPRRIECERRVLGADFEEGEAVWSLNVTDPYKPLVNGWKVFDRSETLIQDLRARLAETPKAGEKDLVLYEDAALYVLYHRHLTPISQAMFGPPGTRTPSKRWGFYSEFRRGWEDLLEVAGVAFPSKHQAPHLFACFSQIRRAFQHIFLNIIGGSLSVARLRAAVWESIFTCDIRRYRAVLYRRMGDFTTLITGPSGTGKELVARAIALSRYIRFDEESKKFEGDPAESFYAVNLAALSPALIESELFGHRRGAFTGAVENRKGWFETCPALGTVFLDEIGELDPSIQVKLLRVIETRTFQPVGDTTSRRFEGKIMAATNRDLADAMRRGTFREDLYYRLCSDQVRTPPLSEQIRESADVLHELIVFTTQRVTGEEDAELARQVEQWVRGNLSPDYPWPGNYRELEQCVRNVLIRRSYEPAGGAAGAGDGRGEADMIERMRRGDLTAEELLRYYITLVYSKTGSYQETARRLALDRRTVKAKITGPAMAKAEKRGTEKVSSPPRWAFKIESRGPIKRSTLELSYPDPEWESLTDVRYWCWCTRLQADQVPRSAFVDFQSRDGPSFRRENLSATASYDEHCLMAAARNLTRAVENHSDPSLAKNLPGADLRALELLRNVYEHWDELRAGYRDGHLSGSAKKLATEFPGAEPWSVEYLPDGDVLLANVVSLRSLIKGIRTLEASARWKLRALRRQGRHQASKTPPKGAAGTGR